MSRDSYIPSVADVNYEHYMLGFISEAVQEADSFLKSMPNYDKIDKTERQIHSERADSMNSSLSSVQANHIDKAGAQLVSGMTDTRPFWEYRTFNPNYTKQTEIFGKISLHLWLQRAWDMRLTDMIWGCNSGGTSYAHLTYNERIQDLDFNAEDVRDVLPFRPSNYHSIQSCEGVIIRKERTVNYGRHHYPQFADLITPDRDGSGNEANRNTRYARLMDRLGSPFREALFGPKKPVSGELPRIPTWDEYTIYLDDPRLNETRKPMYMGNWHLAPVEHCSQCVTSGTPHALNNWSYIVHPGERIYPNKRLIIASNKLILYDNTSIYWHGLYPCPKLTLASRKGTWIGKGLLWDGLPMQKFLDRWLRLMDNHMQKWQQPDLFADKNSTAMTEFNKINTARPGLKVRYNPIAGKGMELRYPDSIPQYLVDMGKFAIEEIGTLTGAQDLSNLVRLNQLPSADSVERIMEAMTPEVRLRSRVLEAFTREFAMITASNIAQFKTLSERIAILGPDGATLEDFDYDAGSLIPDYVHASDFDNEGRPTAAALARGPMPRQDRAKEFLRQVSMHIAPGSLLSASEITDKLLYLSLWREGGIDLETMLQKLGIPNIPQVMTRLAENAAIGLGPVAGVGRPPTAQQMPTAKGRGDMSGIKVSESG